VVEQIDLRKNMDYNNNQCRHLNVLKCSNVYIFLSKNVEI